MRLALLVDARLDDFFVAALAPVLAAPDIDVVGAVVDTRPEPPALQRLKAELRKGRGGYVAVMGATRLARSVRPEGCPAPEFLRKHGVPSWPVHDLYDEATLDRIRDLRPDCLFRCGFGLIREPVLSLVPKGVLSYHHGDIRRYRGQPLAFWELLHGEPEMKVTVQILSPQLDAGRIVVEQRVALQPAESLRSLQRRAYELSANLLLEACRRVDDPDFQAEVVPEPELGDLYTLPNLRQWLQLQSRVAERKLRQVR